MTLEAFSKMYLIFQKNLKSNKDGDFILMDQNGMPVKSEKFQNDRHTTDVSNIKSGLYILRMKTQDYDFTGKVIIIK